MIYLDLEVLIKSLVYVNNLPAVIFYLYFSAGPAVTPAVLCQNSRGSKTFLVKLSTTRWFVAVTDCGDDKCSDDEW